MAQDSAAELAATISELLGLDPNSVHPGHAFGLATNAVAQAERLHSDEGPTASLLKARWLRIAAARDLCHPSVAIPEIHCQLATAETASENRDAVSLERIWLKVLDGDIQEAAESVCALATHSDLSAEVAVQAGALAASLAFGNYEELPDGLVASLRLTFFESRQTITSLRDHLYFKITGYTMDIALGLPVDPMPVQEALLSFCNAETEAKSQTLLAALSQLIEVLWQHGMWSQALEFQLAIASSDAPGEMRTTALNMAFRSAANEPSLKALKKVIKYAEGEKGKIQLTLSGEVRDVNTLHILMAQSEAAIHLATSVEEGDRSEAELIASDSMWKFADAHLKTHWPAVAADMKEAFDQEAKKLAARHEQMLMALATRSVEEFTLSDSASPAPPRHPADFRDRWPAIDISTDLVPAEEARAEDSSNYVSPRTSRSRQVGILAENIFASACAALGWVVSKTPQESDYGIDFRVEPVFDQQIPGIEFFAQIKGTSQDIGPLAPTISIKSAIASYWRTKLVPIAVLLVDVNDSTIRFGWFDGTSGTESEGVTIKLGERFPGFLTETLQGYYESIRTDAVSSAALDSMLEAASVISYVIADDWAIDSYPHLAEEAAAQYKDSNFTEGEVKRTLRWMLFSSALARLRRPSTSMPELLDGPIAATRREIITLADSFMSSLVMDRTRKSGLKDNIPFSSGVIKTEVYEHLRPHLSYLSSRLTMQLAMARSNLTRSRMSQLAQGHKANS